MPKSTMAENLVRESCSWVCTATRPVARCSWEFDPRGFFTAIGGGLEMCWMKSVCRGGFVEVDVSCKPTELWHQANNTAAELDRARADLEAVRAAHVAAQAQLNAVLGTANATPEQVLEAWARRNATEEALEEVVQRLGETLGPLGLALNATSASADAGFLRQQVRQQLSALINELNRALALVEATSAAHEATKQELERAQRNYEDVSQSLEETEKAVTSSTTRVRSCCPTSSCPRASSTGRRRGLTARGSSGTRSGASLWASPWPPCCSSSRSLAAAAAAFTGTSSAGRPRSSGRSWAPTPWPPTAG
eukprot:SRR837773.7611.p1 GENE.SRR837773.7611~~SRR837773.7611.p1  ORF type:complete len:308 (-),score=47.81 SRR837773.7611:111-1034(-)